MSRQGKHKPGKVSVGIYIEERQRALLAYLVDITRQTATDIIMDGIRAKAEALGVMRDGVIQPEHERQVELIMIAYKMKNHKEAK